MASDDNIFCSLRFFISFMRFCCLTPTVVDLNKQVFCGKVRTVYIFRCVFTCLLMTAAFSACIHFRCGGWRRLFDISTMSMVAGYYVLWIGEIHGIITGFVHSDELAHCLNILAQVDASLSSIGEPVSYRRFRIFYTAQLITVLANVSFRCTQAYFFFGYKLYLSAENNIAVFYMFTRLVHFTAYVFILREKFVQVNSILSKMGHELREMPMYCMTNTLRKKLKVVRYSHLKLCKAGRIVDNYFGMQNVAFMLATFLTESYLIYFTAQHTIYSKPLAGVSNIVVYSIYILALTWMMVAILVLCLCTSTTHQATYVAANHIIYMMIQTTNNRFLKKLNLFSLHVKQHKLVFTGWRMFNLDFKFLYDFITAIFTYAIIFEQMKNPISLIKTRDLD